MPDSGNGCKELWCQAAANSDDAGAILQTA